MVFVVLNAACMFVCYKNTYIQHTMDTKNIRYYNIYDDDILFIEDNSRIKH